MSTVYTYIATHSTVDPYVAPTAINLPMLARDTSDALVALSGGRIEVGKLAFYSVQHAVPSHLLCDGREVAKLAYPDLYALIQDSEGVAGSALNFKLPNFIASALSTAATAATETQVEGTVYTAPPAAATPAQTPYYGGVDSGGRRTDLP